MNISVYDANEYCHVICVKRLRQLSEFNWYINEGCGDFEKANPLKNQKYDPLNKMVVRHLWSN
jgi:hypothetical protein